MDLSTVNWTRLQYVNRHAPYRLPPSHTLGSPGVGCFLNPPSHPAYFTQPIYTRHGNPPRTTPLYCLADDVGRLWNVPDMDDPQLYRALPSDHCRVSLWMQACYRHWHRCYGNVQFLGNERYAEWPVHPFTLPFHLVKQEMRDGVLYLNERWLRLRNERAAVLNDEYMEVMRQHCVPANHGAVKHIRRWYPEHEPRLDWIDQAPTRVPDWWTTLDTQPSPQQCVAGPDHPGCNHRAGATCQWCGHTTKE